MNFVIASESFSHLRSNGIRAGRLFAPAPTRVPAGRSHAYLDGRPTVACGLNIEDLHVFPNAFPGSFGVDNCPDCLAKIQAGQHG